MTQLTLLSSSSLPTPHGPFRVSVFSDASSGTEHTVLSTGVLAGAPLVRVHSECFTGDVLKSLRCDCGEQLDTAMQLIAAAGAGLIIYMRGHEGRGIGLANKIKAYALQDQGMDTIEANHQLGFPTDQRDYAAAIAILNHYGVSKLKLITNNSTKIKALEDAGFAVVERVPLWVASNPHNEKYLATKRAKMGHI